jgi:glycosyltransferase involved in cell wall biosynthesis
MRIGIDANPLAVRYGGIRRYTERLVHALPRLDPRNEYVLYAPSSCRAGRELPANVAWETLRFPAKSWLDLVHLPRADGRIDLYHGTNYGAPLFNRFPTVVTVHDLTVHLFPANHPLRRRLRHRLLPTLCRRANRLIADSYCTKADLVTHYGIAPQRIQVVYLAAGEEFRPIRSSGVLREVRDRYGLPEAFVLFVGSLEPRKNVPLLVRAMAELLREGVAQRLVIAGEGDPSHVSALRREILGAGLELGRDVILTGFVAEEDLPALYSLCDLFVYPSAYEGFGLPPLEAMACGAPVLLPDNSAFRELYRDHGLVWSLEHRDLLASAIRRALWDDALRVELAETGLKLAKSRTWDDAAAETLEVYRRATS